MQLAFYLVVFSVLLFFFGKQTAQWGWHLRREVTPTSGPHYFYRNADVITSSANPNVRVFTLCIYNVIFHVVNACGFRIDA